MAILVDSGILYAYYDRSDDWHRSAVDLLTRESGGLLVPAPVLPEVDHLLAVRLGRAARQALYRGLSEASLLVVDLPQERIARVAEIDRQFSELDLGFVDCAIAALAQALSVPRIATTDRRHFEPLARAFGFTLLPEAALASATTARRPTGKPRSRRSR